MLNTCLGFHKTLVFPGILCPRALAFLQKYLWYVTQPFHSAVVASSFVNQRSLLGVHACQNEGCHWLCDVPLHIYKYSNYLDSKGFHYSSSEVACFNSANANFSALMLGFSKWLRHLPWHGFSCMGEIFMSSLTSGFTAASDTSAGPVAVVYGHSEAFEGFRRGMSHMGPLNDRSGNEPNYLHMRVEIVLFSLHKHDKVARGCLGKSAVILHGTLSGLTHHVYAEGPTGTGDQGWLSSRGCVCCPDHSGCSFNTTGSTDLCCKQTEAEGSSIAEGWPKFACRL